MFKPHVTVACVVHARVNSWLLKRPSTAKRCGTSLPDTLKPMKRCCRPPNASCGKRPAFAPAAALHPHASVDCARSHAVSALLFAIELSETCATEPQDDDIDRCLWVTADEILNAPNLRSPLVAESIRCWQSGRLPLDVIGAFNWPFTEGANGGGVIEYAALKFNVVSIPCQITARKK
jgi:phosphatase NudJ